MKQLRLLFETQQAAQEVAFMLGFEYDSCNMISLPPVYDTIALRTAIELTGSDFCFDGDHYPIGLPLFEGESNLTKHEQHAGRISSQTQLWCLGEVPF